MSCDVFWLLKSVVRYANKVQMPTLQVRVWPENTFVGVSQWSAESMEIWQEKGGLTTLQKNNKVRGHGWEIAQCMRISNTKGASPEQWDILIDHCVT